MPRYSSRYPDGAAGIALVLLRIACAWVACLVFAHLAFPQYSRHAATLLPAVLALSLALGFGTRIVAFVVTAGAAGTALMNGSDIALTMIARACGCAALGLLGPGAYSLDAKLFGRRVIRLEPRGRDRAGDA
jgi:putative oxidoreductase